MGQSHGYTHDTDLGVSLKAKEKMCATAKASHRRRTSCVHKDFGHGRRSSRALTELQRRAADSSITLTPHSYPSGSILGTNKIFTELRHFVVILGFVGMLLILAHQR
jgi:hypothetical protein